MKMRQQVQKWFISGLILLGTPAFADTAPQHSKVPPSLDSSLKELKQVSAEVMKLKQTWFKVDPAGLKTDLQEYKATSAPREKFKLAVSLAFRKIQMEIDPKTNTNH